MKKINKRQELVKFMNESEDNFWKVYTYLNGNIAQCWSYQAEYIISTPDECSAKSIDKLYNYIFGK